MLKSKNVLLQIEVELIILVLSWETVTTHPPNSCAAVCRLLQKMLCGAVCWLLQWSTLHHNIMGVWWCWWWWIPLTIILISCSGICGLLCLAVIFCFQNQNDKSIQSSFLSSLQTSLSINNIVFERVLETVSTVSCYNL